MVGVSPRHHIKAVAAKPFFGASSFWLGMEYWEQANERGDLTDSWVMKGLLRSNLCPKKKTLVLMV